MSICALTTAAAGNWAGLLGTALLAIAALRVLPLGKRLYRINTALLKLAEARREQQAMPPPAAPEPMGATLDALRLRIDQYDNAYETMLGDSLRTVSTYKDKLTKYDAAITIAGLLLTLASDALPLAARWC